MHFLDAPDLNAEVTGCNDASVMLSIETRVSHMNQHISVPLSRVEVSEDSSHYTRDPDHPLQRSRLMLVIDEKRPPVIISKYESAILYAPGQKGNDQSRSMSRPNTRPRTGQKWLVLVVYESMRPMIRS